VWELLVDAERRPFFYYLDGGDDWKRKINIALCQASRPTPQFVALAASAIVMRVARTARDRIFRLLYQQLN